jgi:cytochrome c5
MRLMSKRTSLWIVLTLLTAAVALGQARGQRGGGGGAAGGGGQRGGQQGGGANAQNSPGAAILGRACSTCHAADLIASHRYETADGYRDVVNSMIASGATVSAQELPVLVDYLFATYGKKPEAGAGGGAQAAAADPGKAILDTACTTCHGLDPLANHVYDSKEPYESLVRNMVGYGANVTDAQVPVVAEYMLKTYGKKPAGAPAAGATASASTPDPGKAILESACTVCHGLDGLANHKYDAKAPYESLVKSMVAYGAVVTDAQMTPLVDYMFKTYGKK